jgi:hypothetical protein
MTDVGPQVKMTLDESKVSVLRWTATEEVRDGKRLWIQWECKKVTEEWRPDGAGNG